jgi:N-acetylmuramic acid 6-phosphate etherase
MSITEDLNKSSENLDCLSTREFVDLYLDEEKKVREALVNASAEISLVIDLISDKFISNNYFDYADREDYTGPRLFYIGAGTSGRLGVLDASECPPTFSVQAEMVQGIIAGGDIAIRSAVEGAEDNAEAGYQEIKNLVRASDTLVALSASGNAAYVIAALKSAQELGALTIAISNNPQAEIFNHTEQNICLETGPELLSGSTRLKAGTSQKIVLNMISTGLMIKLNKVYSNLMVDLKASNKKLVKRSVNLVVKITGASEAEALETLEQANFRVKNAVLMIMKNLSFAETKNILKGAKGSLRACLKTV